MTRLVFGTLVVVAAVGACGGSSTEPTVPLKEVWFSSSDPETGRTFRCQMWWRRDGGYAGGLTSFCYESEPVETGGR